MCGIFAIINQNHYDINDVKRHFDMGKKRGPEYSSFNILSNFVTFGFHRLAINGLDNESNQPLRYKSYYLICNGEIYNHHELKEESSIFKRKQTVIVRSFYNYTTSWERNV